MLPTLCFAKDKPVITFDDDFNTDSRFFINDKEKQLRKSTKENRL